MSVDGDIATITLDRPERRNALDANAAAELRRAVEGMGARVCVLTGAGDAFCAGGDLEELQRWAELPKDEIASVLYDSFQGVVRALRASDTIFIAAINGAAVGAGLDVALACDLRVAADNARLGQVWVRLGVIPGTGGAWLSYALAGPTKAAEMLLTGDLVSAQDVRDAGLVNEVVTARELMSAARSWAEKILRHPPDGVIANKRALVAASDAGLEAALEHAREIQPERFTSEEFKAAVRAARSRA